MATYTQESTLPDIGPRHDPAGPDGASRSGVSWPAVFAGAAVAAALTLIMMLLGAGMGLGLASPWEGEGAEAKTIGIAGIFWITFTQLASSGLGGYLAGRLRTKWSGIHTEEARFRDTAHGILSWAVATLVTFALLASAVGSAVSAGAKAGMGVASTVAGGAMAAAGTVGANRLGEDGSTGPMAYMTDSLFRKTPGAAPSSPGAGGTGTSGNAAPSDSASPAEVGRIFANALRTGTLSPEDSRYVSEMVSQRTGLSPQDAEKRVMETYARAKTAFEEAKTKAKAAADAARKGTAYGSLWIFLSLVLGALIASYCATLGGRHRDL
ncbi:hypothetical protein QTI66_31090 [Variovorax sp. J22R133]|uniref:hypothetical protein n=1 Tax=Variovorax brevis TaxID=3053503 RepID=UPI00257785A0|nr:hypothetical protein [Variovorax sp. J22R133]MDM0116593.1 hypothetical protein [Variovorax sp. J22R133]